MLNSYKNKILYFLIMTLGVLLNIYLFFIFKQKNLFQPKTQSSFQSLYVKNIDAPTFCSIIFQMFLYYNIIEIFNKFCQRFFGKKKNKNQEKINFFFNFGFKETLIFDSQLSNNLNLRPKQEKLIQQKNLLQTILKINSIVVGILFLFLTSLISEPQIFFPSISSNQEIIKIFKILFAVFFCLYFFILFILYIIVAKKQSLDEEDKIIQNQDKIKIN